MSRMPNRRSEVSSPVSFGSPVSGVPFPDSLAGRLPSFPEAWKTALSTVRMLLNRPLALNSRIARPETPYASLNSTTPGMRENRTFFRNAASSSYGMNTCRVTSIRRAMEAWSRTSPSTRKTRKTRGTRVIRVAKARPPANRKRWFPLILTSRPPR